MADKKSQGKDKSKSAEDTATTVSPEAVPAATTRPAMAVPATRARIGSEPKRLSKGQRKHVRRQKQSGEIKRH